jgi:hypothetical protein
VAAGDSLPIVRGRVEELSGGENIFLERLFSGLMTAMELGRRRVPAGAGVEKGALGV